MQPREVIEHPGMRVVYESAVLENASAKPWHLLRHVVIIPCDRASVSPGDKYFRVIKGAYFNVASKHLLSESVHHGVVGG